MEVKKLKEICTKAKKVCKSNHSLPILDYAYLDEKSVKVTNLEITYKAHLETGLEHPVCILLKDLDGLVSKLKEGEIELKVSPGSSYVFKEDSRTKKIRYENITYSSCIDNPELKDNFQPSNVEIQTQKGKFSFPTMNPFDFPTVKENDTEKIGDLGYDEILKIRKAVSFVAKDEFRPVMTCVHIDDHIVGTDSHTLAFYKVLTPFENYLMPSACVPLLDEKEVYVVQENKENIFLYGHNETLIHRKIEGSFPNWKAVIPTEFKANGFVNSEQLVDALSFASGVFENKYQQNVKFNFDFDFTSLDLKAECLDNGKKYETELDLKWQEKSVSDLEIKFDAKRLSLILKVEKQEETKFSLTNSSTVAIINDCVLLMPEG